MEKTVQEIGTIRGTLNIRPRALVGSVARGFLYLVAILEPCHSSNERHLHFNTTVIHAHACDLT
jgi:hypothetical protein